MIVYEVPLARCPKTYNGLPLTYAALAAQKNFYAVYLPCSGFNPEAREKRLREGFAKAGNELDMGKGCVRFKRVEDLPQALISAEIESTTVEAFIARQAAR